jgi:hypothetical protein
MLAITIADESTMLRGGIRILASDVMKPHDVHHQYTHSSLCFAAVSTVNRTHSPESCFGSAAPVHGHW